MGCGLQVAGIKEVEETVDVFFNPKFFLWPGGKRDVAFKVFYLEPVFDIDG